MAVRPPNHGRAVQPLHNISRPGKGELNHVMSELTFLSATFNFGNAFVAAVGSFRQQQLSSQMPLIEDKTKLRDDIFALADKALY